MGENIDFSKAIEKVQEMLSDEQGQSQLENLVGSFLSSQNNSESPSPESQQLAPTSSQNAGNGIDLDMIMKIQRIVQAMNNGCDNPKTVFLNSLKPFFGPNRREKLDHATKLLKISAILKTLKDEGGV